MIYSYSEILRTYVSKIGFGCWGIGGSTTKVPSYGIVDRGDSIRSIRRAIHNGINYFDTSPIYGEGESERVLGKALTRDRSEVILATKVGRLPGGEFDFSIMNIRESVYKSLKRLNTDYIDILQLHDPLPNRESITSDLVTTLEKLRESGLVRHFGVSVKNPADAKSFVTPPFYFVQLNFNLIDQRAIDIDIFETCRRNGIEVITRTPLAFGFLTDRFSSQSSPFFHSNDHRSHWSAAQLTKWADSPNKFRAITNALNISIVSLALKFAISQKGTVCTLSGMMNADEVSINAAHVSDSKELSLSDIMQIRQIYETNTFFLR